MSNSKKLLMGITGTIGVMLVPTYLHALREKFSEIKIIMTETASTFISKESISLIVEDVHTSIFPSYKGEMNHVQLARWADLFFILPATANILGQVAHGLASSLLTAAVLAHEQPIFFFPNMNKYMWNNQALQKNLKLLEEHGHKIISPVERVSYEHASGARNTGKHVPPPQEVVRILEDEVEKRKSSVKSSLLESIAH